MFAKALNFFDIAIAFWLNNAHPGRLNLVENFCFCFSVFCCADDVVLLFSLLESLLDSLSVFGEEASPLGLSLNRSKTKIQSLSQFLPSPLSPLIVNADRVEVKDKFVYLGSQISSDCTSDSEFFADSTAPATLSVVSQEIGR